MDNYMTPFILRDALLCLVFLVGLGAGILWRSHANNKKLGLSCWRDSFCSASTL